MRTGIPAKKATYAEQNVLFPGRQPGKAQKLVLVPSRIKGKLLGLGWAGSWESTDRGTLLVGAMLESSGSLLAF